jgi:hypothetical protein
MERMRSLAKAAKGNFCVKWFTRLIRCRGGAFLVGRQKPDGPNASMFREAAGDACASGPLQMFLLSAAAATF